LLYQIYWHWCAPERGQNAVGKLLNARVPHLETKVTGLKALGVRDVFYNLTFIANSVQVGYLWFVIGMILLYDINFVKDVFF
jgi:hypothetical protein